MFLGDTVLSSPIPGLTSHKIPKIFANETLYQLSYTPVYVRKLGNKFEKNALSILFAEA
jgi:hypothetical protein